MSEHKTWLYCEFSEKDSTVLIRVYAHRERGGGNCPDHILNIPLLFTGSNYEFFIYENIWKYFKNAKMCISLTPTHPSFHFEPLQFANKYLAGLARFAVVHLPFFISFKGSDRVHRRDTKRMKRSGLAKDICVPVFVTSKSATIWHLHPAEPTDHVQQNVQIMAKWCFAREYFIVLRSFFLLLLLRPWTKSKYSYIRVWKGGAISRVGDFAWL